VNCQYCWHPETVYSADTTTTATENTSPINTSAASNNTHSKINSTQKIIGFIFLGAGLLCCIFGILFLLELFLLGIAFILYGAFCLIIEKHAGLILGWLTVFFLAFSKRVFFRTGYIFSILILLLLVLMAILTIIVCKKERIFQRLKKKRD